MATEEILRTVSIPVHADYSANQYCMGAVNSSGRFQLVGAGQAVDGVLQDKPTVQDQPGAISTVPGEITKVMAGGTVTKGGPVTPDASGRAVDAATSNVIAGIALDAATAAGQIIRMIQKFALS